MTAALDDGYNDYLREMYEKHLLTKCKYCKYLYKTIWEVDPTSVVCMNCDAIVCINCKDKYCSAYQLCTECIDKSDAKDIAKSPKKKKNTPELNLVGVNRSRFLLELWRNTADPGLALLNPPTIDDAVEALEKGYVEYFFGTAVKADLNKDTVDLSSYDRDCGRGDGTAAKVLKRLPK